MVCNSNPACNLNNTSTPPGGGGGGWLRSPLLFAAVVSVKKHARSRDSVLCAACRCRHFHGLGLELDQARGTRHENGCWQYRIA